MFNLVPKEEKYFQLFKEITTNIIEGAQLLSDMLNKYDNIRETQRNIKVVADKGLTQTRTLISILNKSMITPIEREDIYLLSGALKGMLDFIGGSSQRVCMYNIEKITPEARSLGSIILQSCHAVDNAVSMLGKKNNEKIFEACAEIEALENQADQVKYTVIRRLFIEETNPIELIKWKEIYESLERTINKCEKTAKIIKSIVLKND